MKNYLLGLCAVAAAIALSANTAPKSELISFHFIPANGAEFYYENASQWELAASHYECDNMGTDCCILRVPEDKLYYYSGSPTQQLAGYLSDQGFGSWDYTSATHAVIYMTYSSKP